MKNEEKKQDVVMIARTRVSDRYPGLSPKTLANQLSEGRGPQCFKVGRLIFYKIEDLDRYMMAHPILTSDSEEGIS